jgi:hypothetical protein
MISVSENVLVESECFCLQNKICPFLSQGICIYVGHSFLKKNEKKLARSFNFTFRYIDDVFSLNNSRFGDFVDRIYPIELLQLN